MSFTPGPPSPTGDDQDRNRRLYNPYQDLHGPIQTLYKLPTSPEYLFQEESVAQRRSWGENLTYYTGIGYLSGSVAGAGKGLVEGIKASEPGDTLKLRVNRVLNASGHAGRRLGNRAGVIGLLYAGMESGMVALRDTDDVINSVVAGLGTGAAYRAAAGVRSAAVAGAIGGEYDPGKAQDLPSALKLGLGVFEKLGKWLHDTVVSSINVRSCGKVQLNELDGVVKRNGHLRLRRTYGEGDCRFLQGKCFGEFFDTDRPRLPNPLALVLVSLLGLLSGADLLSSQWDLRENT
ncbi:hypothetical protein RJ640_008454 [Escallonia rubra]|uniref:Mitochondrial import inner membrane translocase subunit TIM23 n=1 Tax=Escallonia rubra TaxID=112253 RepID=A0AA88QAE7_9ASTE|nr:hypothetical protein RJ640_008454 [Escallonia rubra]